LKNNFEFAKKQIVLKHEEIKELKETYIYKTKKEQETSNED
tara:strand:+ start:640 stop:762 length:123 start_codon:yes stop_codon:yes gene_type:complete